MGATTITEQNLAYYWDFNSSGSLTSFISNTSNTASVTGGSLAKTFSTSGSKSGDGYITTGNSSGNQNILKMNNVGGSNISLANFSISFDIKDYDGGSVLFNLNNGKTMNTSLGIWGGGGTASGTDSTIQTSSEWATYVFSFSGSNMTVYRNGIMVRELIGESLSGNLSSLTLGNDSSNENNPAIKASLDNLAIWNTSLNKDDATLLFHAKSPNQLVPESSTASLAILGLSMMMLHRRKKGN